MHHGSATENQKPEEKKTKASKHLCSGAGCSLREFMSWSQRAESRQHTSRKTIISPLSKPAAVRRAYASEYEYIALPNTGMEGETAANLR